MKRWILLTVLCLMFLFTGCDGGKRAEVTPTPDPIPVPENQEKPWYGIYAVTDYWNGGISAMSDEDAEAYLGMELKYSTDSIVWNEQVCKAPEYELSRMTASDFSEVFNGYLKAKDLGIEGNEVHSVDVSNCDFFGGSFTIVDAYTIAIPYDGVYFIATKSV